MCRPSATKFDAEALPVIRGLSSGPAIVTCAASVPFRSSTGIALVPAPTNSRPRLAIHYQITRIPQLRRARKRSAHRSSLNPGCAQGGRGHSYRAAHSDPGDAHAGIPNGEVPRIEPALNRIIELRRKRESQLAV